MPEFETIIVDRETTAIIADAIKRMADASEENTKRLTAQEQRMIKAEFGQEQLVLSVNKMAVSTEKLIETVGRVVADSSRFEQQIIGLEDRALNRISTIVDDVRAVKTDVANMQGRIYILELESAGDAGRKDEISKQRKWWNDNWHKLLMVFIMIVPLIVALNMVVKK